MIKREAFWIALWALGSERMRRTFFFFFMFLYKKNEDGAVKVELLPMILSQGTASWAISSTPSALLPPLPGHHHQHHHHGYHFWSASDGLGLHVHSLMVLPWQSCEVVLFLYILWERKLRLQEGKEVAISPMVCRKEFNLAQRNLPKIGLAVLQIALDVGSLEGLGGFCFCFS